MGLVGFDLDKMSGRTQMKDFKPLHLETNAIDSSNPRSPDASGHQ